MHIDLILEVIVHSSNNQARPVLETSKLRRYRILTWSGQSGGYARQADGGIEFSTQHPTVLTTLIVSRRYSIGQNPYFREFRPK